MRKFTTLIIAGVFILGSTGIAQAATIYTPGLVAELNGSFVCTAVNVSRRAREITIEILDTFGGVVDTTSLNVGPGGREALVTQDITRFYCRVVVSGGKNTVRVALISRVSGSAVAVVEGR